MIGRDEIGRIEPRVIDGRDPSQEILALVTEDGYTVDYKRLCHSFIDNSLRSNPNIDILLDTKLVNISKDADHFIILDGILWRKGRFFFLESTFSHFGGQR